MNQFNNLANSQEFYSNMAKRRSVRSFEKTTIDNEILINAIKAAGTAPSGANTQPWFFALVTNQELKNKIRQAAEEVERKFYTQESTKKWVDDLKPFGTNETKAYLSEAAALIVVFSKNFNEVENGELKRTYYPLESCGIAVGLLLTSLHNAGVSTLTHTPRPLNFLNILLGLNNTYKPFMIIVAGKSKFPLVLPDIVRKNIDEIMKVF